MKAIAHCQHTIQTDLVRWVCECFEIRKDGLNTNRISRESTSELIRDATLFKRPYNRLCMTIFPYEKCDVACVVRFIDITE